MVTRTRQTAEAEPYTAISHPVRRRILDLLVEDDMPVHALAQQFEMSRPAVSQHLKVLLDSGLVSEQRHGRERRYRLAPDGLRTVRDWIAQYERFWDDKFERLREHLEETNPTTPTTPAHEADTKRQQQKGPQP
ncbi:MAG: ArsR family transcriptional regulator [Chloroflexi bacterium]|nr:MAG: ArsR family transcriptional regulator [Chloroflexota bacterium]